MLLGRAIARFDPWPPTAIPAFCRWRVATCIRQLSYKAGNALSPGQRIGQSLRVGTSLRADPQIVLASRLIELNQAELEAAVEAEIESNPALERLDDVEEPITEEAILRRIAPQELAPSSEDFEFLRSLPQGFDEEIDWIDFARSTDSLRDHLRAQLIPELPKRLRHVGVFVLESVDERGYLTAENAEIALETNSSLEDAARVVRDLQSCEPAGVGARTLQECLLLQLRSAQTLEEKLARKILKRFFPEFLAQNFRPIMRQYRVMPNVVSEAFEIIRSLNPYPGEGFMQETSNQMPQACAATADVILHRDDTGWSVLVPGLDDRALSISASYRARLREMRAMTRTPKDEQKHILEHVDRASRFISAIAARRENLQKIGHYLIEKQSGFVSTGEYRFLKPMTRVEVADAIGVHDSTVSRATQNKFVQLPTGQIIAFEIFFKSSLRIQKMIENILANENPESPLSDEQIARILAESGVQVARRTVNKYRDRSRQLSSRMRKYA